MVKKIVTIFFLLVFVNFILAPTFIKLIDNSVDISEVYNIPEEEKNSKEIKDIEILFFEFNNRLDEEVFSLKNTTSYYYFKNYIKPHINLISPPPKNIS